MKTYGLVTVCAVTLICNSVAAEDYEFRGEAYFENVQGFLLNGENVPYIAVGVRTLGDSKSFEVHTGAIMPTSEPEAVFADEATTILQFKGIQGPNPFFGGKRLHVTFGRGGIYFNSWEALSLW